MKKIILALIAIITLGSFIGDKPAYKLYNAKGKSVKYKKMIEQLREADVVFFGESHDDPINHWLEYEITADLYKETDGNIILSAEMFETDNQLLLNEYLESKISEKSFEKEAKLWPNYKGDYKPLVKFAKDSSLQFIASNIPRRYASVVYKKGFEGLNDLPAESKSLIAPLPIEYDSTLPAYQNMLKQMAGMGHANQNLPKAQAIKDATMGYSLAEVAGNGKIVIHYNGSYHSNNYEGIIWYLNKYKPGLKIATISSVQQSDIFTFDKENENLADFIIVVDDNMTKTR